jgi:hypothetical protein
MKIRIMGTKEECTDISNFYKANDKLGIFKSLQISALYPNRNSYNRLRVYIDVVSCEHVQLPGKCE